MDKSEEDEGNDKIDGAMRTTSASTRAASSLQRQAVRHKTRHVIAGIDALVEPKQASLQIKNQHDEEN